MQIKIYMFLKSVHRAISRVQTSLSSTQLQLEQKIAQAESIAKGRNRAKVFATTDDMLEWIKNDDNKGQCNVGDNLYIVDVGVPDWWISEVLEEKDQETGQWYKIAQLETQKVDLTPYLQKTGDTKDNTVTFASEDSSNATTWKNVAVLASGESHSSILNKMSKMFNNLRYVYNSLTAHKTSGDHDNRYVIADNIENITRTIGGPSIPTLAPADDTEVISLYIPYTGKYIITGTVGVSAPSQSTAAISILVNLIRRNGGYVGQTRVSACSGAVTIIQVHSNTAVTLQANDTIYMTVRHTHTGSLSVNSSVGALINAIRLG